jgi:hypothetical protein
VIDTPIQNVGAAQPILTLSAFGSWTCLIAVCRVDLWANQLLKSSSDTQLSTEDFSRALKSRIY